MKELHCEQEKDMGIQNTYDFAERTQMKVFDRRKIQLYMEADFPDSLTSSISKKTTRWLNKMTEFGLIKAQTWRL